MAGSLRIVFPNRRVQVSDDTPVAVRLALVNRIANEAIYLPAVQRAAGAVAPRCLTAGVPFQPRSIRPGECEYAYAARLLDFVQAIPYVQDPPGEWFQSVLYTLANGGDCEDKVSLFLALARYCGYDARPVWMNESESAQYNHVTAQIRIGAQWLWAETIVPGARLGEEPHAALIRVGGHEGLVSHA